MYISEELKRMLTKFIKVKDDDFAEFFEYLATFFIVGNDCEREQAQKVLAICCLDFLKAGVNPDKVVAMMTYNDIVKWYSELVSYGAKIDLGTMLYEAGINPSMTIHKNYFETQDVTYNNLYKLIAAGNDINWLVAHNTGHHDLTEIVAFNKLGADKELLIKEIPDDVLYENLEWLVDTIGFEANKIIRLFDVLESKAKANSLAPGSEYEKKLIFLREKGVIDDDDIRQLIRCSCDYLNKATYGNCSGKEFAGVKITPEWLINNTLILKIFDIFDCRDDEDLKKRANEFGLELDGLLENLPGRILFEYHQGYPEDFDEFLSRLKREDIIKAFGRSFYAYCRKHQDKINTMDCLRRMLALTWHGADIEADLIYLSYAKRFENENEIWSDYHVQVALELLDAGINVTTADTIATHLDYARLAFSGERFGVYRALRDHGAKQEYLEKLKVDWAC